MGKADASQSEAVTDGIRVKVETKYLPEHSTTAAQRYVFAYRIRVSNESGSTVQLKSRHWIITHGDGLVEEVKGEGVVGEQPILAPGEGFEYSSGCVLRTPRGTMRGTYQFVNGDDLEFDVTVAEFVLEMPFSLN
ncbi:MAG: Co2+/Mg2+ efflux protein ApaG [Myxococcales bacterium]|nr:Co2+/Mg2+ efflux protein ApaG [Myxococcales bacterium]